MLRDRCTVCIVAKRLDGSGCHLVRLGTELGLGPGDIVLDGDLVPHGKGHSTCTYRHMSIVAKRSPMSATAELLLHIDK